MPNRQVPDGDGRQLTDSSTRLRARLREETSATILAAAERAIGEEGLHAARIEVIATYAGVSVGTIYNHFKDRTTLVQALFDSRGQRLAGLLEEAMRRTADLPARDQVRALLEATAAHGREHGRLFGSLLRENHGPARIRPPDVTRAALAMAAAAVVSRGIATGQFREDRASVFAEALTALARQAFACAVDGRGTDDEIDALADVFVLGVHR